MAISDELLLRAIDIVAEVPGMEMDPDALADDVVLLAHVWSEEDEFECAVASVRRAMLQLIEDKTWGAELKYNHAGWSSYHFQHRRAQGAKADMRIVYKKSGGMLRVRGFGHRRIPKDIYDRLHEARL